MKHGLALLLTLPTIAGCTSATGPRREATAVVDGTRFTIDVPRELVVTWSPRGLVLALADAVARRAIDQTELTLVARNAPSAGPTLDRRRGGGAIRYGVARNEGGSGGAETTLVARRACGAGDLQLRSVKQAEDAAPNFESTFAILESARCAAASAG